MALAMGPTEEEEDERGPLSQLQACMVGRVTQIDK